MPIIVLLVPLLLGQIVMADTRRQPEVTYSDQSAVDRQVALERYGLNDGEWNRVAYLQVLDRPFGRDLSPIELLGKYAETDEERARYARIYTTVYVDQMRRSQAWALAIQQVAQERDLTREVLQSTPQIKAGLDRLGIRPPIMDATRALYRQRETKQQTATTLFVSLACEEACGEAASRLSRQVLAGFTKKLDMVFVGSDKKDQDDIINWAKRHHLNVEQIRSGAVELHLDSDYWREVRSSDAVPRVLKP